MTVLEQAPTGAERAECTAPSHRTIIGFTRHSQAVPPTELPKIDQVASPIETSHRPGHRLNFRVRLIGHADLANTRGRDFVNRTRAERARIVEHALRERLPQQVANRLRFEIVGRGSSQRGVMQPRTEAERMQNRRVEMLTTLGAKPRPKPPRDLPLTSHLRKGLRS